jgi:hypothetical protein
VSRLDLSLLLVVLLFVLLSVIDLLPDAKLDPPPMSPHAPGLFLGR